MEKVGISYTDGITHLWMFFSWRRVYNRSKWNKSKLSAGPTDVKALMAEDISFAEFRKGSRSEHVHHLKENLPKQPTYSSSWYLCRLPLTTAGVRAVARWQSWIMTHRKSTRKTNKNLLKISIFKGPLMSFPLELFLWLPWYWLLAWIKIRGKLLLWLEGLSAWTAYWAGN